MNPRNINPTTLELIKFTPQLKNSIQEVTTAQIFDSGSQFHPSGLFSTTIFGRVGTEQRSEQFARINLNVKIMQPIIYKTVCDLGSLYKRIMEGKETVIFDEKTNDFVISSSPQSKTGYHFFISNLHRIKFKQTGSERRAKKIELVEKSISLDNYLTDMLLVIPAGMRDYTVSPGGKPEEDEINALYRTVISRASLIDPIRSSKSPALYNETTVGIQKAVYEIYNYIITLLEGKNKLIQGKWTSRKIFNTTSNVISSYVDRTTGLSDKRRMLYNDTRCGLYQYCRSAAPLTLYNIRNKYIRDIFPEQASTVYLTNVETMKKEEVVITGLQKDISRWTTNDGLEKVIASLGNPDVRDEIVYIGKDRKYCIGLLYRDNTSFKFFQDIDELPPNLDRSKVQPVTLFEFIYMSIYSMSGKYPGFITRYPITGYGSIYPSWVKIVTTIDTETLRELDYNWEGIDDEEFEAVFFPIRGSSYMNTLVVNTNHISSLGGDFDGDTCHLKMVLSAESIEEVLSFLDRKEYYVGDHGDLFFSTSNDILEATIKAMS